MVDGRRLVMDEAYATRSIRHPKADVVWGHLPKMPEYAPRVPDEAIQALVAWLKSGAP